MVADDEDDGDGDVTKRLEGTIRTMRKNELRKIQIVFETFVVGAQRKTEGILFTKIKLI